MSSHTLQLITPHRGASFSSADKVDVTSGPLAVRSRRLSGGRRDGVLLVELVAGSTKVFVLPDRGLGIWKIMAGEFELGWQSPAAASSATGLPTSTQPAGSSMDSTAGSPTCRPIISMSPSTTRPARSHSPAP